MARTRRSFQAARYVSISCMRHKYATRGVVLSRTPHGEANLLVSILTPELGLVRARAQSARKLGAKLAPALATFAESDFLLVKGSEGWRVAGAQLARNRFTEMGRAARLRAARVTGLLLRLVAGEAADQEVHAALLGFFDALAALPESVHDAAECVAALRLLATLGFIAGSIPEAYEPTILAEVAGDRRAHVLRINQGIAASGL